MKVVCGGVNAGQTVGFIYKGCGLGVVLGLLDHITKRAKGWYGLGLFLVLVFNKHKDPFGFNITQGPKM